VSCWMPINSRYKKDEASLSFFPPSLPPSFPPSLRTFSLYSRVIFSPKLFSSSSCCSWSSN